MNRGASVGCRVFVRRVKKHYHQFMDEVTILNKHGSAECRICGLNFVPDSEEDRERHEHEHRRLIWGGLPEEVREFLKAFGWAVAHNDGALTD